MEPSVTSQLSAGHEVSAYIPPTIKIKEQLVSNSRNVLAFNQLTLPANNVTCIIPNKGTLHGVSIEATVAGATGATNLAPIFAYNLLNRIEYQVGSSTRLFMDKLTHFLRVMEEAKTLEMRAEIINLAGGATNLNIGTTPTFTQAWLSLPFARLRHNDNNTLRSGISMDVLGNKQIQIYLNLESSANLVIDANGILNSTLTSGQFHLYIEETMKSDDVPKLSVGKYLPFSCYYDQTFISGTFTPAGTGPSNLNTINVQGFRKGQLVGIQVASLLQSDRNGFNFAKLVELRDFQVLWNGQILFREDNQAAKLYDLMQYQCPFYYTAYGQSNYWHSFILANKPSVLALHNHQDTLNLSNQTIQFQFSSTSTSPQILVITYIYQAAIPYNDSESEIIIG